MGTISCFHTLNRSLPNHNINKTYAHPNRGVRLTLKAGGSGVDLLTGVGLANRILSAVKMFQPMPVNRLTDGEMCSRFTIFYESFYRFSSV